jgi:hypothetical protein
MTDEMDVISFNVRVHSPSYQISSPDGSLWNQAGCSLSDFKTG